MSNNPHNFITTGLTVNSNGEKVTGPFSHWIGDRVRLHHYYTRSKEDWEIKMRASNADSGPLGSRGPCGKTWEMFHTVDKQCTIVDRSLADWKER